MWRLIYIDVVWLEGKTTLSASHGRQQKEGYALVDWASYIPKLSVIAILLLFDFQLTKPTQLRKATIGHLKEAYTKLDH